MRHGFGRMVAMCGLIISFGFTTGCIEGGVPSNGSNCSDTVKNGSETDIDCGGSACGKCVNGKACQAGTDCASGVCANSTCTAAPTSCSNGSKDNAETDVDCGEGCTGCANGKACLRGSDCASGRCVNNACVAQDSTCSSDSQCGSGQRCENSKCVSTGGGSGNGRFRHVSKNGKPISSYSVTEHEQGWTVRDCRLLDSSTVLECWFTSPASVTDGNAPGFNGVVTTSEGTYNIVGTTRGCNNDLNACGITENGTTEIFVDGNRLARRVQTNTGTGVNLTYPNVCLTGRTCRTL